MLATMVVSSPGLSDRLGRGAGAAARDADAGDVHGVLGVVDDAEVVRQGRPRGTEPKSLDSSSNRPSAQAPPLPRPADPEARQQNETVPQHDVPVSCSSRYPFRATRRVIGEIAEGSRQHSCKPRACQRGDLVSFRRPPAPAIPTRASCLLLILPRTVGPCIFPPAEDRPDLPPAVGHHEPPWRRRRG